MRRILKIILFILLLVAVVICISWFAARNKAEKAGMTKPTFKEFLSRDTNVATKPSTEDGLSEETPSGGVVPPSEEASGGNPIASISVSQFTGGPLVPAQEVSGIGLGAVGTPIATGISGSGSLGSSIPSASSSPTSIPTGGGISVATSSTPVCSDADLNIEFTADEISRLNALQDEFLSIASTLHTDADVQAELANYTVFKAKSDQATELYNYCQSKAYQIQSPAYFRYRIATPFWRTPGSDRRGYHTNGGWKDVVDPRNTYETQSVMEHLFKLNLW